MKLYLPTKTIDKLRRMCAVNHWGENPEDPSGRNWEAIADNLLEASIARERGATRLDLKRETVDWIVDEFAWLLDNNDNINQKGV